MRDVSLQAVFHDLHKRIVEGDESVSIVPMMPYVIVDDSTGLTYHLHDQSEGKPYEVYHGDDKVITGVAMAPREVSILDEIKHRIMGVERANFLAMVTQPNDDTASMGTKTRPTTNGGYSVTKA